MKSAALNLHGRGRKGEGVADQKQVLCNLEKLPSIAEMRPGQQNCPIITDLSSQQNQEEEAAFCTETSYMLLDCKNQRGKEIYFMFSRDPKHSICKTELAQSKQSGAFGREITPTNGDKQKAGPL